MEFIRDLGMLFPTKQSKRKHRYSEYKCHCGTTFKVLENAVKGGRTKSCGCSPFATLDGLSSHRLYGTWRQMLQRCENPSVDRYSSYGGAGITVCSRWKTLPNFIEDMYPSYTEGLTLDRKDNTGNYCPTNCRWADNSIQTQNIRPLKSNNTSGYKGVNYCNRTGKWIARITNYGTRKYLGLYATPELAYVAYRKYIEEHGLGHSY